MSAPLLPCPFCGGVARAITPSLISCGGVDGRCHLRSMSIDRATWNRRAPAPGGEAARVAREALQRIIDYEPEYFDYPPEKWAEHTPETCAECARWEKMKHPLQYRCEAWVHLFYGRKDENARREATQYLHMRDIARDALAALNHPAQPAGETVAVPREVYDAAVEALERLCDSSDEGRAASKALAALRAAGRSG